MSQPALLLTGANGRTGRAVLRSLSSSGVAVRAFVRQASQADELKKLGAREISVGDLMDTESLNAAVEGVSKILHIGPPMHPDEVDITGRLIEPAKRNNIDHFVYYSVMHPLRREVRHHRLKLEAEESLVESGLPFTILQPARYMQHLEPIWRRVVDEGIHEMPFSVEKKFNVVDLADLADACAIVASSDRHLYATYELAGPEALSQEDMAQVISQVLGRAVTARQLSWEATKERATRAGASEDRISQMLVMNRHYDNHGFRGNSNVLEYLLGRPATRFSAYVSALQARELEGAGRS